MGGKDAAIVLADCDLPRTVAAITHWTLSNAGQACGAIEIAYRPLSGKIPIGFGFGHALSADVPNTSGS